MILDDYFADPDAFMEENEYKITHAKATATDTDPWVDPSLTGGTVMVDSMYTNERRSGAWIRMDRPDIVTKIRADEAMNRKMDREAYSNSEGWWYKGKLQAPPPNGILSKSDIDKIDKWINPQNLGYNVSTANDNTDSIERSFVNSSDPMYIAGKINVSSWASDMKDWRGLVRRAPDGKLPTHKRMLWKNELPDKSLGDIEAEIRQMERAEGARIFDRSGPYVR